MSESGVSKLKVLIVLVVLGLGFNEGLKYLIVQMDFQRMKDAMDAKAAAAQVLKDDEIRGELAYKALELGLPLTGEHFLIVRDDDNRKMTIKTAWDVSVRYLWGLCGEPCVQNYHFEPVAEEAYSTK